MRENRIIIYILINFNKYDYFAKINKLILLSYSGGQKENKMACFFCTLMCCFKLTTDNKNE